MSLTVDQIVARLLEPETPVVWLDPSMPEELWNNLPAALSSRGLAVLNLDTGSPISDHDSLLDRFSEVAPLQNTYVRSLTSLKDCLLKLPHQTSRGWVVMFRHPEALRQNDEETFEDFLEVLEQVDAVHKAHHRVFKLVVRD